MPQTEEEHLENQNLDYEDMDKPHADAEVRNFISSIQFHSYTSLIRIIIFLEST